MGECKVHLINRREGGAREVCSFPDYPLVGPALWSLLSIDRLSSRLSPEECSTGDVVRLHPLLGDVSLHRSLRVALSWTTMRTWCPLEQHNNLGRVCQDVSLQLRYATDNGRASFINAPAMWNGLAEQMFMCTGHVARGELAVRDLGLVFQWNSDRCSRWWESERGRVSFISCLDLRTIEDVVRAPSTTDKPGLVHEGPRDLDLGIPRAYYAPRPPRTESGRNRPRRR